MASLPLITIPNRPRAVFFFMTHRHSGGFFAPVKIKSI
nr:MAG TPA: hypothetical protein [Caudoviricetes sp.]